MKTLFLKPRLDGARFADHSVPLEALRDWAAFEELVIEVARDLYLKDHPGRKRAPRGFTESFSLSLSGIEEGSAQPVIEKTSPEGMLPGMSDYFDRARDLIVAAIAAAALGAALPVDFPTHLTGYFDQFGRSLRSGERVEFIQGGNGPPVIYDQTTRKRLILSAAKEYRQDTELRGRISEVDVEKRSYTLKLAGGERIAGVFAPALRQTIVAALDQFESAKVLILGVGVFDGGDRLRKIEQTTHIEILDPNDVPARLEELALLKDGWLDNTGKAPSRDGLRWLTEGWLKFYPDELPDPFAYPTEEGNVQLEWTLGKWEISAEIELATHRASLSGVELGTDQDFDQEADLNIPEGWATLVEMVRSRAVA